jgi:hypothetical protein
MRQDEQASFIRANGDVVTVTDAGNGYMIVSTGTGASAVTGTFNYLGGHIGGWSPTSAVDHAALMDLIAAAWERVGSPVPYTLAERVRRAHRALEGMNS